MKGQSKWLAALVALFIGQGLLYKGVIYDHWEKNYAPKNKQMIGGLDPTQLLATVAGFRELVAGILWVRADSFFDTGNYDAVLPLIRLVTWLDPHQIDVFATGMWHIGYNFTDEQSRSDRRYLPAAIALGKEGASHNSETYELFFETGWLWYHKVDDSYGEAVNWFEQASTKKDMLQARRNLLANAYLRNGQVEEALDHYTNLLAEAEKTVGDANNYQGRQIRDTIEGNLDTLLVRMVQRGYLAQKRADGSFESGPYDVKPPFDVNFSVKATVEDVKVIGIDGTWGVAPVGTRVRVVLRDADYPHAIPAGADWGKVDSVNLDPDPKITFMQDQLFVRNKRFNRQIDLSRDPTMYPMTKDKYFLEFYYNPRSAPAHIQDKFGFNGEGMTDKNHVNSEVREGQKVIFARFELTKDQLLRRGEWRDKVPVLESVAYQSNRKLSGGGDDLILVPNLRANPTPAPGPKPNAPVDPKLNP